MNLFQRAAAYSREFIDYPPVVFDRGWLYGIWMIGACYRRTNDLYGAYPPSYLRRVHSMFPNKRHVLHLFSGGLRRGEAINAALAGRTNGGQTCDMLNGPCACGAFHAGAMELVDCHDPNEGRFPTYQGDVTALPVDWAECFDLVLADPPYSAENAKKYAHRVTRRGAFLVWLDQKLPMYKKKYWKLVGTIGLVRSTNHRIRLVSIFERQAG